MPLPLAGFSASCARDCRERWRCGKQAPLRRRGTAPPTHEALRGATGATWSWQRVDQLGREIAGCLPDLEAHQVTVIRIAVDQPPVVLFAHCLPRSKESRAISTSGRDEGAYRARNSADKTCIKFK